MDWRIAEKLNKICSDLCMQLTPLQDKTITEIFEQPMRSGKSTLIALLVLLDPSAEDVVKYMKARMRGIPIGERNEHKH